MSNRGQTADRQGVVSYLTSSDVFAAIFSMASAGGSAGLGLTVAQGLQLQSTRKGVGLKGLGGRLRVGALSRWDVGAVLAGTGCDAMCVTRCV